MLTTALTYNASTRTVTVTAAGVAAPAPAEYHLVNLVPDGPEILLRVGAPNAGAVSFQLPQDGVYRFVLRLLAAPGNPVYADSGLLHLHHETSALGARADQAYVDFCRAPRRPAGHPLHTVLWFDIRQQAAQAAFQEGNLLIAHSLLATTY